MSQNAGGSKTPAAADNSESSLPGFSSVTEFSNEGIRKILAATKAFQSLPSSGPSWDLHKSYPEFNRSMKLARNKLIPLMSSLLKHANIPPDDFKSGDVDEKFDFLVESNDDMLERIGRALDEADGLFKKAETIVVNQGNASVLRPPGTWGKRKLAEEQSDPLPEEAESKANRNIKKATIKRVVKEKPQLKFKTPVDNSVSPFIPKLTEKPNSIKPLSILPEYNNKDEEYYGHPYFVELNRWEPLDKMMKKVDPVKPKAVEMTHLIEINTEEDLQQLLRDLRSVPELAIDLEHHSYRSFLGFTCLMQISTRDKDYVIDTLTLREHLGVLNEVFTNPKIVKVFHGSSSDIEWLQKDFGLYVVNMFDTQIAAKLLCHQQLSLQSLLDKYCGISQNKAFQLADWRIRPLSKDMIHYARQDTHSLLYIYDVMKNELIETGNNRNNLLVAVYDQSKLLCLKRYEKPGNNPKLALRKMRRSLNNRQVFAFMELYKWRDEIARERDESIAYILPNHMLLMISEQLPKEMTGILACCDPVPPLVHSGLGAIHKIVTLARELPLQEHTNEEKSEKRQKLKDWVILMNSVHDVGLSEITKINHETDDLDEEETQQFENIDESGLDLKKLQELQINKTWPMPLPEPKDGRNIPTSSTNPSIFFNSKVKAKRRVSTKREHSAVEYNMDAAATPFDRYQLSKDIMELLQDPSKKAALDMENPVVKAVYETAFCDPTEQDEKEEDEISQKPEKVFTEGEFIPFNPLAQSADASKSKKRKRQDEWDDSKALPAPQTVPNIGNPIEDDDDIDGEEDVPIKSNSEEFLAVSSKSSERPKGKKKKNKRSNFLNNLKNPFSSKNKRKAQQQEKTSPEMNSRRNNHDETLNNSAVSSPAAKRRRTEASPSNPPGNSRRSGNSRGGRNRNNDSPHSSKDQNKQRTSPRANGRDRGGKRGGGRGGKNNKGGQFYDFRNKGSGSSRSMTFK